jgi:hypothetical protein
MPWLVSDSWFVVSMLSNILLIMPRMELIKCDFDGMMKTIFKELSEHSALRATLIVSTTINRKAIEEREEGVCELPLSFTERRVYG